jgi:hypothetical protein
MLASIGMTFAAAHTLELVPKMNYAPELYAEVTSTLYRYYGTIGGPIQVSAILASVILSFLTKALSGVLAYGSWDVLFDRLARIVVCARTTRQRGVGQRFTNGPAFGGSAILP